MLFLRSNLKPSKFKLEKPFGSPINTFKCKKRSRLRLLSETRSSQDFFVFCFGLTVIVPKDKSSCFSNEVPSEPV